MESSCPTISVIVPIYNVEKYLNQCIESIVLQTYTHLEIILVDDGSPDTCPQLCDDWTQKDSRIRVIHKKNGGLSDARNSGINAATGEFLAFIDADDFIEADMFEKLVHGALSANAEVAVCGRYIFTGENAIAEHCSQSPVVMDGKTALRELLRNRRIDESACDKIFRRELFANIVFPVGEVNEDLPSISRVISKCNHVIHIGTPKYYYRYNPVSISKSVYSSSKSAVIKHLQDIREYISSQYSGFERDIRFLEARYTFYMLMSMAVDKEAKTKFRNDYLFYRKLFNKRFLILLSSKQYTAGFKIRVLCVYFGIFGAIWRLKRASKI